MNFVQKRGLSTLIPPKIASPTAIGAAQDAARMQRVINFYEKLPRGPAPEPTVSGPFSWYKKRYFGKNASIMPVAHLMGALIIFGYAQNYYYHLRHHKNNAH